MNAPRRTLKGDSKRTKKGVSDYDNLLVKRTIRRPCQTSSDFLDRIFIPACQGNKRSNNDQASNLGIWQKVERLGKNLSEKG
jgi:hypothetical protein